MSNPIGLSFIRKLNEIIVLTAGVLWAATAWFPEVTFPISIALIVLSTIWLAFAFIAFATAQMDLGRYVGYLMFVSSICAMIGAGASFWIPWIGFIIIVSGYAYRMRNEIKVARA